jgi:hypothetical protein
MQRAAPPACPVPPQEALLDVKSAPWSTDAHVAQKSPAFAPLLCGTSTLLPHPAALPGKRACLLVSCHAQQRPDPRNTLVLQLEQQLLKCLNAYSHENVLLSAGAGRTADLHRAAHWLICPGV